MIDDLTPYQDNIARNLGIICGITFCIIYFFASKILRKKALKNIENKLEADELILCEGKMNILELIIPFAPGGFLGEYVIPFVAFSEVQRIDTIDRQFLPLFILAELICIIFIFIIASWKCVFTNKRMSNGLAFIFPDIVGKLFYGVEYLYYSEIKKIDYSSYFGLKALYATLKNNKRFRIPGFLNLEEIKLTIEKYIGGN